MNLTAMKTVALGLFAFVSVMAVAQGPAAQAPKPPRVLQGVINDVNGNIVVLEAKGDTIAHGRQIDLSSATFESESGHSVARFPLKAGDRVLVVIDPSAPTEWRPTAKPGQPMSMMIRVLPLKVLVVERIAAP